MPALQLHPNARCGAAITVEAEARRPRPDALRLTYVVTGAVGDLWVPEPAGFARTDELWKRTCFEAFLLPGPGQAYVEFNLAPCRRWATYRFDTYREGMRDAADVTPSEITVDSSDGRLELSASIALPASESAAPVWRLGLTAVIEEANGNVSHWALGHPSPQPDFHNALSFVHELAA